MQAFKNIFYLGVKELRSLMRDPIMIVLIIYALTLNIYTAATAVPEVLHKAPIAIVDEDQSALSKRITDAFYPPYFQLPALITPGEMDKRMDAGLDTFALYIPSGYERDLLAGRDPALQLNVDATRMGQAFNGSQYIQVIVSDEINEFLRHYRAQSYPAVEPAIRVRFNPELNKTWFGGVMEIISAITMLSVVLTGAALIREREHGTIEHLLVMPVRPVEILCSKIWAMTFVVLIASAFSLNVMVRGFLSVPIEGSLVLFFAGTLLHVLASTALGIFLATVARSMPQFGLLLFMVLLPMQILSGAGGIMRATVISGARKSTRGIIDLIMQAAPTTHFVTFAQAILFRGAGFSVVWHQFLALALIGAALFTLSLWRFRRMLRTTVT